LGLTVWDGAVVLAKYFEQKNEKHPELLKDATVLELGSGTGLVGIALAALGADVTITDLSTTIPILHKNVELNKSQCKHEVQVKELYWGQDTDDFDPDFDYIIGADVIYQDQLVPALLDTIKQLSGPSTKIYLSFESHNGDAVQKFEEIVGDDFERVDIPKEKWHKNFVHDAIQIVKLTKK